MPAKHRSDESSPSRSQSERATSTGSARKNPVSGQIANHEVLEAEWELAKDRLPEHLALRVHRALSWLGRAEKESDDPDAAFIFYWIAFNAAYAKDRQRAMESTERSQFADFFDTILTLDSKQAIYDAIWTRFSDSIRLLLDNEYVFQPFWDHHAGRGSENWERLFERRNSIVRQALGDRNTGLILSTLFDRLYVLRIQLMHGGASWGSSVNRDQVQDGARILAFLVPLFIELMMSHPEIDWGPPDYPVVNPTSRG